MYIFMHGVVSKIEDFVYIHYAYLLPFTHILVPRPIIAG
jgi:hypothetical protein